MTRLIDADVVLKDIEDLRKSPWYNADYLSEQRRIGMKEALDMVVSACITHQPTVDAVPVEFIKEEIKSTKGFYSSNLRRLLDTWAERKE